MIDIKAIRAGIFPDSYGFVELDAEQLTALCDEIERLHKDSERYQWLAAYLVSTSNQYDDLIVEASETSVEELNAAIDAVSSNKIELSNKRGI